MPFVMRPVVLITLFATAACGHPSRAADFPNVLIILADDLGYGDVRPLNADSRIPTPAFDRLAAEGTVFSDAHSPSAVCTPTRYGLLTGRYCWRTSLTRGVLGGYSPPLLKPDRRTLAHLMRDAGYRTGIVGKWHLGLQLPMLTTEGNTSDWDGDPGVDYTKQITDGPLQHGFDSWFGITASLDMPPYVFLRDSEFVARPTRQQKAVPFPHFMRKGPRSDDFIPDQVLDRLTEEACLRIQADSRRDAPWFLYVPLTGPHKPALPHSRFRGRTGLGEYADFVAQVDDAVGRILMTLEECAVTESTLVVVTSDNGSYMKRIPAETPDHQADDSVQGYHPARHQANGDWKGTKADIWEAGHRVPFFIRWPGHSPAARHVDSTICLTDLYATIADLLNKQLTPQEAEDSFSLLPMLKNPNAIRPAPVIHHSAAGMFSLRQGKWKLVAGNGSGGRMQPKGKPFVEPWQLFNLDADPSESNNVAADHPQVMQQLRVSLNRLRTAGRSRLPQP